MFSHARTEGGGDASYALLHTRLKFRIRQLENIFSRLFGRHCHIVVTLFTRMQIITRDREPSYLRFTSQRRGD